MFLEGFVNDNHSFSLVFISIDEEIIYPYIFKKNLLKSHLIKFL